MSTDSFYQNLKSFSDFKDISYPSNFQPMPMDWVVIITDIKGSTQAIREGRYRDVNTIGAASIVAVQNVFKREDFPYVFGGDGATLVVAPEKLNIAVDALTKLKVLSRESFGLELRVGTVTVEEIVGDGAKLEIAKFELAHGKCVAMFRGGGLSQAEKKIKEQPEKYEVPESDDNRVNLDGLSCRWNAIPNKHGRIMSLIVAVTTVGDSGTYQKVLQRIEELFDGDIQDANPVNLPSMTYKSFGQCIKDEKRYYNSMLSIGFISRVVGIVISVLALKFKIPPLFFNPKTYTESMSIHSDYRKFDDSLRMIIDCSEEQCEAIREYLDNLYQNGLLFYGLFESEQSLMTCFVQGVDDGNHIHFVDGGDGGYAMAAAQLKAQMKASGN